VRQRVTAGASVTALVVLVFALNFYRLPVVALTPGPAEDVLARIKVEGNMQVYESKGKLYLTSVGIDDDVRFYEALLDLAGRLDADPETRRGRPSSLDEDVRRACEARDGEALDALAHAYDQTVPDPAAGERLRTLSTGHPIVGYFGKLIPQKGVSLLLRALSRSRHRLSSLIVGFGLERERLTALAFALAAGDEQTIQWVLGTSDAALGGSDPPHTPLRSEVVFTGRLDHRYAPVALAAMDVLVVPSVLEEAFGMVAAEGAAAGALPLLARHSGLGEVAAALEGHVGRPQLFSFEPGPGAPDRIATGIDRLIELRPGERNMLREAIRGFVADKWSWRRTAAGLLKVAGPMT